MGVELVVTIPDEASHTRPCSEGCGLAAAPGDTMCTGCREGHERNRPVHWTEEFPQDY